MSHQILYAVFLDASTHTHTHVHTHTHAHTHTYTHTHTHSHGHTLTLTDKKHTTQKLNPKYFFAVFKT